MMLPIQLNTLQFSVSGKILVRLRQMSVAASTINLNTGTDVRC